MRFLLAAMVLLGCGRLTAADTGAEAGQTLAEQLRAAQPAENSTIHGTLIIQSNGNRWEIPMVCRVTVNTTNWQSTYETSATAQTPAERLVIVHHPDGPNQYFYARGLAPATLIPNASTYVPLAGSDFSLGDLGMEFLHWPGQQRLKGEMRLGQPCYVLESSHPPGGEIVRVKSDIDKESGGLLIADGYDANNHLIKEFSLHGSSFKKVQGQWRLEKMDIRNKKTGSHTELKFDLNN